MASVTLLAYKLHSDLDTQPSGTYGVVMNDSDTIKNGYYLSAGGGSWSASPLPSFQQPGTGAAAMILPVKVRQIVNSDDYVQSGDADYSVAINRAIAAVSAATSGGVVELPAGTFAIGHSPIVLMSGVTVRGQGRYGTILTGAGSTQDLFQSQDYGTLHLSNAWSTNDGVPYGFGIEHLSIDGTDAESGNGITIYGKNYRIHDVVVANCAGIGLYTECGTGTGSPGGYIDQAGASITNFWAISNGSDGIKNLGPHDAVWDTLVSCLNGGWGMQALFLADTYDGNCVLQNLHTFGNKGGDSNISGLNATAGLRGGACWILEDGGVLDGDNNMVAEIRLALGGKQGWQLTVSGAGSSIGMIRGSIANVSQNGVTVTGGQTTIAQIYMGATSDSYGGGTGLLIDAPNVTVGGGILRDFDNGANGGCCLQLGVGSEMTSHLGLDINLTLQGGGQNLLVGKSPISSNIKLTSINSANSKHIDTSSDPLDMVSNDVNIWCGSSTGTTHYDIRREGYHGLNTKGDQNVQLYWYGNQTTLYFNAALTANRTVTLNTTVPLSGLTLASWVPPVGSRFRTVRSATATGAFNLTVGSKVLSAASTWVDHEYDGSAWQEVASGTL